jgi:hypothetical protein
MCDPAVCNTYFAAWVPWRDSSGDLIWSIGHNRWTGSETPSHLADYRPTFHRIELGDGTVPGVGFEPTLPSRGRGV